MKPLNEVIPPQHVKPSKIAPLSVLPVFFNLEKAPVLIVGNSDGVAWKLELILAAGANVTLLADAPGESLRDVIEDSVNLVHEPRRWEFADLNGKRLALGDFETQDKADRFAKTARSAGVPVNVIDRPEFCDFQFGSIVNRSPVIVSISTSGAAPILAQNIRSKIEMLLPPSIAGWAGAAKAKRAQLANIVPDSDLRKQLWRQFATKAFIEPVEKIESFFERAMETKPRSKPGKVTLVGAGPGDAELLTIRALRALQSADVILFDKLVSDEVLELARREAKRMIVGKRGGQPSCRQDEINDLMVKLAGQGKHVVRLKSGDPMIFGRAGEEISILEKAGITVEVVPGITSALAAASRLGVSLTHRDHAQSVKFITAHSRKGELPELDWASFADQNSTLMVYMGAGTAPKLAKALIEKGADPKTPLLVAKGISRESETIAYHRLHNLLDMKINRTLPVLIGIGSVFEARCKAFENTQLSDVQSGDLCTLTA